MSLFYMSTFDYFCEGCQWVIHCTERIANELGPISRSLFHLHRSNTCWACFFFFFLPISTGRALEFSLKNNQPIKMAHNWSRVQLFFWARTPPWGTSSAWAQIWPQMSSMAAVMKSLKKEWEMESMDIFHRDKTCFDERDETERRYSGAWRTKWAQWAGWEKFETQFTR